MLFQTDAHKDYDHLLPSMYKSHEILVYPQTYFALCHMIRRQGLFLSDYIDCKYLYMRRCNMTNNHDT